MTSPLALSPAHRATLSTFGAEAQPLLSVEDALADLPLVRAIAARHSYRPIGPFYPGLRAPVSDAIAMPLVEPLLPTMRDAFGLAAEPRYFECYLSLVTLAPADLAPIQRLPHFDGVEPGRIAVLLYLSDDMAGGTAFYRQRATGFESVDAARFDAYRTALDAGTARHGLPEAAYIGDSSPLFERTFKVDGAAGRMIAYRGNTLHCAAPHEGFVPDADPRVGRLTLNLFLKA
ncbi:DUF6445 family protein [Aurantiacibacter luteus]|uniref:Prolyl 4-hydroxylase alpha subunit domain-containing protein n=1 Tax=Aurantiacibacter luteus TaxID=1581420 RepID=A0A0G9MZ49_9SPHN|nr:DUF6445 family protein [Aurantiacibacter luteus]KLE35980.1 hypothetical protein AAW00_00075 [Aurantiacibacter luteus]